MRMIVCTGSERPITQVKFNRDDDLLFASSLDGVITLWKPDTGERLGTYNGHQGAVFAIDIDFESKTLLSAGGDGSIRLWDVLTGKELYQFVPNRNRITSVDFSCGDKHFLGATPQAIGKECIIHVYQNPVLSQDDEKKEANDYKQCELQIDNKNSVKNFKASKVIWSPLNNEIFGACSDGTIRIFDVTKEKEIQSVTFDPNFSKKAKNNSKISPDITDLQYAIDQTCLIATSRNKEARMFDLRNWNCIKTYETNRGLNTVAVHPTVNAIAIGGGKSAQQAALESGAGDYEVLLEHIIFEEKMGVIDPECFSPLNSMTFNSDASLFALGYEEGTVRIFKMDANFEEKWTKMEQKFIDENLDDEDEDEDEI